MQFEFTLYAEPHEKFAPGCFDSQIGKKIPFHGHGMATLLDARVIDDGNSVLVKVDV